MAVVNPFRPHTGVSSISPVEWERRLLLIHEATDTDEFIQAVFRLLEATVVCDFTLVNLRNLNSVPLVTRDSKGREFGVEYMERFFKANPSVSYVMLRPGLRILHTKDHLPPEPELKNHIFYRDFMQPENWRNSVALLFWGFFPPIPQNSFCVFRREDQPDFDEDDLARLRLLHPHIAAGLKRLKKQLKTHSQEDRVSELLNSLPVNATLLDWDLRVTHQTDSARRLYARWNGREHETLPRQRELPIDLRAICEEMKTVWHESLRENPHARLLHKRTVPHPASALTAEITLLLQQDSVLAHPGFLIHLLELNPDGAGALETLRPELNILTPGERKATLLAAEGLTNQDIASRLGISIAAVKLRLHGAFKKLKVRNRTQLVALLRGAG